MIIKLKENKSKAIIITGPTASGKSSLALDLAKKYNGVIINADSQQIYTEIAILSSQPSNNHYKKVPHKLFNFLDFYKNFSVNKWFSLTKNEIELTLKKKKMPIIVGGTGMYINTLLNGLNVFPKIPTTVRKKGNNLMKLCGVKIFYKKLKAKNKMCVNKISPNDKIRLLRSWEIYEFTKKSIYELNKENNKKKLSGLNFYKILIFPPRKEIYLNCKERWKNMLKLGAINEVKLIMKKEKKMKKKALFKTIGFNELKKFLQNKISINKASEQSLQATRNYAKRQYTWFKHQFTANIIFKEKYEEKTKEYFLKEIRDKLLTN